MSGGIGWSPKPMVWMYSNLIYHSHSYYAIRLYKTRDIDMRVC